MGTTGHSLRNARVNFSIGGAKQCRPWPIIAAALLQASERTEMCAGTFEDVYTTSVLHPWKANPYSAADHRLTTDASEDDTASATLSSSVRCVHPFSLWGPLHAKAGHGEIRACGCGDWDAPIDLASQGL